MSCSTAGTAAPGLILLRGTHQLAVANGLPRRDQNARTSLTFYQQWGDPATGLEIARDGLEIGRRRWAPPVRIPDGRERGASARCGWANGRGRPKLLRSGWPTRSRMPRGELHVDRAILSSLRGEDATGDIAEATRIRLEAGTSGPQFEAYELWAKTWAAFVGGHPDEVRRLGAHAVELMSELAPLVGPLLARSALWAGDPAGAAFALASPDALGDLGAALAADRLVAQAGIDALEGRGPAAHAGYREALRAYRKLGLAFDEAAAAVDMAILLASPERDAADVVTAIAAARETLERLGARPFLARLDAARTTQPAGSATRAPTRPASTRRSLAARSRA